MGNLFYDKADGFYFQENEEKVITKVIFSSVAAEMLLTFDFDVVKTVINVIYEALNYFKSTSEGKTPFALNFTIDDVEQIVRSQLNKINNG